MGKIDKLASEAITPEEIYGPYASTLEHREITELYANDADPRGRKMADVTIGMLSRFFEPESPHGTNALHIERPVVLAHPSEHFDDGHQLTTFRRIALLMFQGRGIDPFERNVFMMPYRSTILPVCHNVDEGRMIIGQSFHNMKRPAEIINKFDEAVEYLRPRHEQPLKSELVIPKVLRYVTVLAHAELDGVNGEQYELALHNQQIVNQQQEEIDRMPFTPVVEE